MREVLPHLDALYANALRLTHARADAEDLVQETVLRAFRFFDRFERGTNLKAWLLRIQYNTFVNRYRRADAGARDQGRDGATSRAAKTSCRAHALRALTDPSGNALRPLIAREIEAALDCAARGSAHGGACSRTSKSSVTRRSPRCSAARSAP